MPGPVSTHDSRRATQVTLKAVDPSLGRPHPRLPGLVLLQRPRHCRAAARAASRQRAQHGHRPAQNGERAAARRDRQRQALHLGRRKNRPRRPRHVEKGRSGLHAAVEGAVMRSLAVRWLATAFVLVAAGCATAPIDLKKLEVVDLTYAFDEHTLYWPNSPSGFELKRLAYGPTPAAISIRRTRSVRRSMAARTSMRRFISRQAERASIRFRRSSSSRRPSSST